MAYEKIEFNKPGRPKKQATEKTGKPIIINVFDLVADYFKKKYNYELYNDDMRAWELVSKLHEFEKIFRDKQNTESKPIIINLFDIVADHFKKKYNYELYNDDMRAWGLVSKLHEFEKILRDKQNTE